MAFQRLKPRRSLRRLLRTSERADWPTTKTIGLCSATLRPYRRETIVSRRIALNAANSPKVLSSKKRDWFTYGNLTKYTVTAETMRAVATPLTSVRSSSGRCT